MTLLILAYTLVNMALYADDLLQSRITVLEVGGFMIYLTPIIAFLSRFIPMGVTILALKYVS